MNTNIPKCRCNIEARANICTGQNNPKNANQPYYDCQYGRNGCGFFEWANPQFKQEQQERFEKKNQRNTPQSLPDPMLTASLTQIMQKLDIILEKLHQ